MPYDEQPRYMGTLGLDKTWFRLNFWSSGAAAAALIVSLLLGRSLAWSFGTTVLVTLILVGGSIALTTEYHSVLVVRRLVLRITFHLRSASGLSWLDARTLYTTDAPDDLPEPRLQLVGADDRPLLGPVMEDPV